MVTILISLAFRRVALIRGEALVSVWIPNGAALVSDPALIGEDTVTKSSWRSLIEYIRNISEKQ